MKEQLEYFHTRIVEISKRILQEARARVDSGELDIEDFESGARNLNAYIQGLTDRFVLEAGFDALNAIQLLQGITIVATKKEIDDLDV